MSEYRRIQELARDTTLDAFMTVGPVDSKITADAIAATARTRGGPKFLPIDVSEAIALKHRLYESEEIPGSVFNVKPAWPDDKLETVSVSHLIVARKALSETTVAAFYRQLFALRQAIARQVPGAAHITIGQSQQRSAPQDERPQLVRHIAQIGERRPRFVGAALLQQREAALKAASHLCGAEVARAKVAVGLARQRKATGHASQFAGDESEASLALAIAIRGRGVNKGDRPREDADRYISLGAQYRTP